MIVFWKGRGILVVIIVIVCAFVVEYSAKAITGNRHINDDSSWPASALFIVSALIVAVLEKSLLKDTPKTIVDKETGRKVTVIIRHSLLFIPIRYWPYVLLLMAMAVPFLR